MRKTLNQANIKLLRFLHAPDERNERETWDNNGHILHYPSRTSILRFLQLQKSRQKHDQEKQRWNDDQNKNRQRQIRRHALQLLM